MRFTMIVTCGLSVFYGLLNLAAAFALLVMPERLLSSPSTPAPEAIFYKIVSVFLVGSMAIWLFMASTNRLYRDCGRRLMIAGIIMLTETMYWLHLTPRFLRPLFDASTVDGAVFAAFVQVAAYAFTAWVAFTAARVRV